MKFKGKTILITGASGGIGSETARLFAEEGANITINYFSSPKRAEKTVKQVKDLGREAFVIKADVSEPDEVSLMVKETMNQFGRLDVLVNNAAQHPPPRFNFERPDWMLWKQMAHVNILGILVCAHFAAPHLRATNGNIVNVVMDYDPGGVGYTLTKTAGTPLTRGLARQLAPIRVNAVSPGAIDTWGMNDEEKRHFIAKTLLQRVGNPLDIAQAILFLASNEATYITGETLHVDGGSQLLE